MVCHGHFRVNGKKVDIPAFLVKTGDTVELKPSSREIPQVISSLDISEGKGIPAWLEIEKANFLGKIRAFPTREELTLPVNEKLVVELYSR